jgi:tetratricopeptide (TPR) repeat protein
MLSRIIQILKNIWQSLFKPQPPESAPEPREAPKPYKPLSDADYEYLFDQLLEGIAYGWQPGRIQRFFETLGERADKEAWLSWLERYELRVMTAPAANADLRERLIKLGEQCQALSETSTARKVGDRVRSLGMRLQARGTLNEIWEYSGPDASTPAPLPESTPPPAESLLPPLPVEGFTAPAGQLPPPPTLERAVQDLSWEELLVSLQQNPDFVEQVTRELGLETTNLQAAIAAIAEQVQRHRQPTETSIEDAETWFNRGVERYEVEDFATALNYWERALELRPNYYQAWNNRGLALKQLGRIQEGLDCYNRALEIEPTYYKAWYNQGIVLEELQHFDPAIASYDKALEFKADYYKAWSSRGDALREKGDFQGAIASYDQALSLKADLADVWSARGHSLVQLGQTQDAIASFDKAIALKAEMPHVWSARGRALALTGAWEAAIASFDKALQLKADAWETWLARSLAARLSPTPDLLLTSLSAIAADDPRLNQRGDAGELATLEAGLNALYPNTHPEGWGQLHAAIGRLYARLSPTHEQPKALWHKAVERYNEALTTLTEEAFPRLHLEVLQDLIQVQYALEETARANKLLQRGAGLLVRLLDDPQQSVQPGGFSRELSHFNQLGVDLAIQSGEYVCALELAEQGKFTAPEPGTSQPVNWTQLQDYLGSQAAAIYWHWSPIALSALLCRGDRCEPLALGQPGNEVKSIVLTPSLRSQILAARANPAQLGQILLDLLDLDGHSETTPSTASTREMMQRLQRFETWYEQWEAWLENPQSWETRLSELLVQLSEILALGEILQALSLETLNSPPSLLLISGSKLLSLPLPALFDLAKPTRGLTVRCLPNAGTALRNHVEVAPESFSFLSIAAPDSREIRDAVAQTYFAQSQILDPSQMTKAEALALLEAQAEGASILDLTNVREWGLEFCGPEILTWEEINSLPLCSPFLVLLPPGRVEMTQRAEQLLARGVAWVLLGLWETEAQANFLLRAELYRLLAAGTNPPVALQQSQQWLAQASDRDLIDWYRDRISESGDRPHSAVLESQVHFIEENPAKMGADRPRYEHPYYWAGLLALG